MPGILTELGVDSSALALEPHEPEAPVEELEFDPKEQELELAAAEAEKRKASAPERIRLWLELAEVHREIASRGVEGQRRARLRQAELVVRRALEIAAQARDTLGYLASLDALADIYSVLKKYPATEKLLTEGIRIEAALPHPDPLRTARRIHLLGVVQHRAGRPDDAVPVLERAVKLHEKNLGADHEETIRVLAALGAVHRARSRYDLAEKCLHHAVRYFQRRKGPAAPDAIEALSELAGNYEDAGDRDRAAGEYERMLLMLEREIGRNQDEIGEMQFSVASMYIRWGDYTRARELLGACLGTFRRGSSARLAVGHETLAHVEEALGHYSDAVRELANAAKAWSKCKNRNAELAVNLNYRAELLDQLKRKHEAAWLREQAAELGGKPAEPVAQPHAVLRPSSA